MVKKPIQKKITYNGKEFLCQKLTGKEAFILREEYANEQGEVNVGLLLLELIDRCTLKPDITADDIDHPDDIRDFGLLLYEFNYGRPETESDSKEDKKKQEK